VFRFHPLMPAGTSLGLLLFAASFTPSLLPRALAFQVAVSAVSMAAGYALGCIARWLWRYLELPEVRGPHRHQLTTGVLTLCALIALLTLWNAAPWQNAARQVMGLAEIDHLHTVAAALGAVGLFGVLLILGRLFRRTALSASIRLGHLLPRRIANVIGITLTAILFWTLVNQTVLRLGLQFADSISQQVDAMVPADTDPPRDPGRTGSAASRISWQDLGRQGRSFVSSGPTIEQIRAFSGAEARSPIRIYVGLNAADSPEARAQLALAELQRVGAFDRSLLLLLTPTGTGWIDPPAIDALEYLHHGDTAAVAVQYSYLPSMLSLTLEEAYGAENARALFDSVYRHWVQLPSDTRPRLYLHGVSLGALNSSRSFHLHDILGVPFDGALWSGPPFRSREWMDITAERQPGTPAWRPVFRNGSVVRFMNQDGGLDLPPDAPWGPYRIVYLQYASDPITFFSPSLLYREPEWLRGPRGPDVSPDLRWYPVVTMLQVAADMLISNTMPPGTGHTFAAEHYVDAWRALTEPAGWTDEDVTRLKAGLARP